MNYTLKDLQNRVNNLIAQQGEDALMQLNFYIGEIVDLVIFIDGRLKHRAQVSVLHHMTHRAFFNFVVIKMQKEGGRTIGQLSLANFDIQHRLRVICQRVP